MAPGGFSTGWDLTADGALLYSISQSLYGKFGKKSGSYTIATVPLAFNFSDAEWNAIRGNFQQALQATNSGFKHEKGTKDELQKRWAEIKKVIQQNSLDPNTKLQLVNFVAGRSPAGEPEATSYGNMDWKAVMEQASYELKLKNTPASLFYHWKILNLTEIRWSRKVECLLVRDFRVQELSSNPKSEISRAVLDSHNYATEQAVRTRWDELTAFFRSFSPAEKKWLVFKVKQQEGRYLDDTFVKDLTESWKILGAEFAWVFPKRAEIIAQVESRVLELCYVYLTAVPPAPKDSS